MPPFGEFILLYIYILYIELMIYFLLLKGTVEQASRRVDACSEREGRDDERERERQGEGNRERKGERKRI